MAKTAVPMPCPPVHVLAPMRSAPRSAPAGWAKYVERWDLALCRQVAVMVIHDVLSAILRTEVGLTGSISPTKFVRHVGMCRLTP